MIQFRIEDTSRQRPIKRVLLGGDATNTENSDQVAIEVYTDR